MNAHFGVLAPSKQVVLLHEGGAGGVDVVFSERAFRAEAALMQEEVRQ
jgi:hypothetical protein